MNRDLVVVGSAVITVKKIINWYRHRFCLHDRLETMSVLIDGIVYNCPHSHLRSGFLDRAGFWAGAGDDIRCVDCGQLWVATLDTESHLRSDPGISFDSIRSRD